MLRVILSVLLGKLKISVFVAKVLRYVLYLSPVYKATISCTFCWYVWFKLLCCNEGNLKESKDG